VKSCCCRAFPGLLTTDAGITFTPVILSKQADGSNLRHEIGYSAEILRKALHLLALLLPVGIWNLGRGTSLAILIPMAAVAVAADYARSVSLPVEETVERYFGRYMRPSEKPRHARPVLNGATSILIGALLTVLLFEPRIAASALAIFIVADAAAALIGKRFGTRRLFGGAATLEGSTAFVTTGIAVAIMIPGVPMTIAVPVVLAAAFLEALPLPSDDNILVPLGTAAILSAFLALQSTGI